MCLTNKLTIKSNIKNYDVIFEKDNSFFAKLLSYTNSVFVIDENVYKKHAEGCLRNIPKDKVIILPISEEMKNLDTVCGLYERIMRFAPKKNMTIVSIGGGITQDVTGFVASSLYRGVKWIFIPTTLLAQVDSCIGAKTSLNFEHFKNLIGTFYPPCKIHIYPEFLKTLTQEDFYSGVGEMTKLHLMDGLDATQTFIKNLSLIDKRDMKTLLKMTHKCLNIKKSYIENDEFDTGKRNMLNYGHCFGHAIESATNFAISHGQAVVLGMILANKVALNKGFLSKENEEFIYKNVLKPILIVNIPPIDVNRTIQAMKQDKKNTGNGLALVMINNSYEMLKITHLTEEEAKEALINVKN